MISWLRAHGTIAGAVLIASGLTLAFGYVAVDSLLGAFDPERLDSNFTRSALGMGGANSAQGVGGAASNASAIIGIVIGAVVILSLIIIIGLAFRRDWAREAGVVIYGLLGLMSIAVSLGGLSADPPAPSAWVGMLTGLANVAIVVLLMVPPTSRDFRNSQRARPAQVA
ncbi:MAG: hypothetical protein WBO84_09430 [Acidimicrobiia bacterium]|jgi:hypothetical protein